MRRSPFSLVFQLGPWPVVVEPMFWLVSAMLAMTSEPKLILGWVIVCFVSILIHELGHATMARLFGQRSLIRLHAFGGTTHFERALSRWRDLAVALAGPFAGFVFGALIWTAGLLHPPHAQFGRQLVGMAVWINIGWGLMNLVPVLPLDGGHVLRDLLGPKGQRWVKPLGLAGAAFGAGMGFWLFHDPYIAVFFVLMAVLNLNPGQGAPVAKRPGRPQAPPDQSVAQGWAALGKGEERQAEHFARQAITSTQTPEGLNAARDLLAWVLLAQGDGVGALSQLEKIRPQEKARALSWALAYEAVEMPDRALPYAKRAVEEEPSLTSANLAFRLALGQGELAFAGKLAQEHPWPKPFDRDAKVAAVALAEGRYFEAIQRAEAACVSGGAGAAAVLAARAHAAIGQADQAVEWLGRAAEAGALDGEALEAKELAPLAGDPRLGALLGAKRAG